MPNAARLVKGFEEFARKSLMSLSPEQLALMSEREIEEWLELNKKNA